MIWWRFWCCVLKNLNSLLRIYKMFVFFAFLVICVCVYLYMFYSLFFH